MIRKTILAGAVLLVCCSLTRSAQAFTFWTCGGVEVVWDTPFSMVQNTFSIAPGGVRESSLNNAINRWRGVGGMLDMVSKSSTVNSSSKFTINDGQNDVAIVKRADIGGNNGLTVMISDICFFPGDMEWVEADVQVASDLIFTMPEETSLATNGRDTFLHEFGHAHGLEHFQGHNNTRASAAAARRRDPRNGRRVT
jgi:hypothetical protein